jgi:hypothetical protein
MALLLVLGMAGSGRAQVKMVANVPDFYQHQFWEKLPAGGRPGWEAAGGWCRPTAITDALYPWKVQAPYSGLFNDDITKTGKWLSASGDAIQAVNAFGWNINGYLQSKNLGPAAAAAGKPSLTAMWFGVVGTTGQVVVNLAGGRTEVVSKDRVPYSATTLYQVLQDHGRTSVLVLNQTPASRGNGLWWSNYHAVAGAGYDAAKQQILFADPDSNKGNLAANAGWWNLTPTGSWDRSPGPNGGLAKAIARVQNNRYTAADGNADPPLPGNKNGQGVAYTNSALYGTITLDNKGRITASDGLKNGVAGVYDTGRYVNTRLAMMAMISPTLAARTDFRPKGGKWTSTFSFAGDINSRVDQIELFPTVPLADRDFTVPKGSGWEPVEVKADPYDGDRPGGGLELIAESQGADLLSSGRIQGVMLDTDTLFSSFDVYYHDSLTDEWIVQSEGANPPDLPLYQLQAVPEPTTWILLALGVGIAGIAAWGGRRQESAASGPGEGVGGEP